MFKAPLLVQVCRLAFGLYAASMLWPMWSSRRSIAGSGIVTLGAFAVLSLLALICSVGRTKQCRWVVAVVIVLVPLAFWSSALALRVFTWPSWWEWPLVIPLTLGLPLAVAVGLFRNDAADAYFRPARG